MAGFFRKRNFAATTVVVFVLFLTALCEARLSYSFTFGPADVMPLSRRAKTLIMLQTSISLIIIAVLAANVINALDSN